VGPGPYLKYEKKMKKFDLNQKLPQNREIPLKKKFSTSTTVVLVHVCIIDSTSWGIDQFTNYPIFYLFLENPRSISAKQNKYVVTLFHAYPPAIIGTASPHIYSYLQELNKYLTVAFSP
jgi:hypothetical protein